MEVGGVIESGVPAPIRLLATQRYAGHGDDVIERCYQLWRQSAESCRAAVRRYQQEVPAGTPIPTHQTLSDWARAYNWNARAQAEYERDHGQSLYARERRVTQLMDEHLSVLADAQSGAYDDNPAAGIVRMKPGELLGRLLEKQIIRLAPEPPKANEAIDSGPDIESMTPEEKAAWAREMHQAGKGKKRAG